MRSFEPAGGTQRGTRGVNTLVLLDAVWGAEVIAAGIRLAMFAGNQTVRVRARARQASRIPLRR